MGLLARPLECDSERKLTIVRGSLRNHNRGGVLIWDAGAVRPIFLLQTPTAGYNTWCLRGRVDSFGYLPVSLWRTKDCFFPRSLARIGKGRRDSENMSSFERGTTTRLSLSRFTKKFSEFVVAKPMHESSKARVVLWLRVVASLKPQV